MLLDIHVAVKVRPPTTRDIWGDVAILPPPVLRGRVREGGFTNDVARVSPLPSPPPEYRGREKRGRSRHRQRGHFAVTCPAWAPNFLPMTKIFWTSRISRIFVSLSNRSDGEKLSTGASFRHPGGT